MARDLQAQQEVSLGQIRVEFEKAQHEIEELRSHLGATERERDASMQQLAAERIRTSQMQTQVSSSADAGIHVVPPFASQHMSSPPGIFEAASEVPAVPQTPDRRPAQTTSSPVFGLFTSMIGDIEGRGCEGNGKGKSNGAKSNPDW
eukprot:6455536-Amphidinium_carterae.1